MPEHQIVDRDPNSGETRIWREYLKPEEVEFLRRLWKKTK